MRYPDLQSFITSGTSALAKGPVALIFVEDQVEVRSTIEHHLQAGFASVVAFAPFELDLPSELEALIHVIRFDTIKDGAVMGAINALIDEAPGIWMYYCFNAEYLFHPFCETRTVSELLTFHAEERRDAMLTYVVDLYAEDLNAHPNAVSREHAWLDKSGYYTLGRKAEGNEYHERQLDFFGGLRWRFEEHVAPARRKIDRIALFRAKKGLQLRENHTFNDEEYNTYSCPWHHNLTAAIVSFRAAKALKLNAGSTYDIPTFKWHNSTEFNWTSQQLMDLGLMEPGQWF